MTSASGSDTRRRRQGRIVRLLVSLGGLCAIVVWLLAALFLWLLRCDDVCSGDDAASWEWTGQLILACFGAAAGVAAGTLGFTRRTEAYRLTLGATLFTALVWAAWLSTGVAAG